MATSYTGLRVQDTYNAIIKIGDNSNLTGTPKLLSDGLGNDSPLYLSGTRLGIGITPAYQFHTSGNAKIGGNLIISGNLTVNGTLTYLNVEDLQVEDPLIKLAKDNTANTLDIGFFGKYVATGTKYKGLFNDASDDKFKLFIGTETEPTTTVDTTASGYSIGTLVANLEGNVTGDLTGNADTSTGVLVTADSANTSRRMVFTESSNATNTDGRLFKDSLSNFFYNPSTNILTVGTVSGNVTGGTISGTTGTFSDDIELTGSNKYIYLRTGTNSGLWQEDNFALRFGTNNIQRLIISNSGEATFSGLVSGIAPTSDLNFATKKYVDDNTGNADVAKRIDVTVKNVSGGSLAKGVVVHAAPTATPPSGNVIEVVAADANVAASMPAIGVLNETIANEAEGEAVMFGAVSGIDTSSFSIGDELYVSETAGAFTATKPTAFTSQVQKIAVVIKSHASNGLIKVFGAGRSNDVPNRVDRDMNFTDDSKLEFGDDSDFEIFKFGAGDNFIRSNTGHLYLQIEEDDHDMFFQGDDGSGAKTTYFFMDGSEKRTKFLQNLEVVNNNKLILGSNDESFLKWDTTATQLFISGESKFLNDLYVVETITSTKDGIAMQMDGGASAEGIRLQADSSTTYPVFLRSVNPASGETSPWLYRENYTDWGIWHNNPNNSFDFTRAGQITGAIENDVGGSSDSSVMIRLDPSDGSGTFVGNIITPEIDLPSGGMIDWANGDARIVEGLVNNYSLSFQTYDGTNVTTALRLDGNNTATFTNNAFISSIANATTDTDKFLVSDSGEIKYRTGAEVASDILGNIDDTFVRYDSTLQTTSHNVMVKLKNTDTDAGGYGEIHILNDNDDKIVVGSIGSGYTGGDWQGATYVYNTGTSRKMYIKSQDELRFFTGGTSISANTALVLDTSQNAAFSGDINISLDKKIKLSRGSGDYSNIITTTNYPSQSFTGSSDRYWLKAQSKGGFHIVLNTDGSDTAAENSFDDFVIFQGVHDGTPRFRVSNVGNTYIAGNLGVNITNLTAGGFTPKLALKQTSNSEWGGINVESAIDDSVFSFGNAAGRHIIGGSYRTTAGYKPLDFLIGGSTRMTLNTSGNLSVSGTVETTQITATNGLNYLKRNTDASLQLRSENTRSGLFITKPATDTVMGSALVLADESYRLGTASYYHMVMLQNGNTYFNQNVGIGTNSPHNDVSGLSISATSSTDQLYLERTGSATGRYYLGTANNSFYIVDDAQSATRMVIDSSGNVGIGKDPDAPLVVYRTGDVWHTVIGNDSGQLRIGGQTGGGAVIQSRTQSETARDLYLQRDGGRVGIGVNSTSHKLHVDDATNAWLAKFENDADENIAVYVSHGSGYGMAIDSTENDAKYLLKLAGGTGGGTGRGSQIRMYVESSGKVGIGSSTPDNQLTVKAANCIIDSQSTADSQTIGFRAGYLNNPTLCGFFRYTTADAQLYIDNNFTGNDGVYSDITFRNKTTGGVLTNRMRIKGSSGYVGIATDNPLHNLQIGIAATSGSYSMMIEGRFSSSDISSNPRLNLIDQNFGITAGKYGSGATDDALGIFAYQGVGRGIVFAHTTNGAATSLQNMRQDMFIDGGTGDVGIGMVDPDVRLTVYETGDVWHTKIGNNSGQIRFGGQTGSGAVIQSRTNSGTARDLYIQRDGGNVGININDAKTKLHIGPLSGGNATAQERLRLSGDYNGTGSGALLRFTNQHNSGANPNSGEYNLAGIIAYDFRSDWGGAIALQTAPNTNQGGTLVNRLVINPEGRVGIANSNPGYILDVTGDIRATSDVIAFSDKRVKENINTVDNALEKVSKLRGVTYTRKDIDDKSTKVGVIAQEVLDVLPEVVSQDDKGKYSVAYGNMAGVFIEAIKELKAEVDSLKQEIKELKK